MGKNKLVKALFGTKQEHDLKKIIPIVHEINSLEPWAMGLSAEQFPKQTETLKEELKNGASLDDLLPRAFALGREAARRVLGERLYDVQVLGGIVLHQGKIMEMKTGEGKTVSCVPAAYLNALAGDGVHIITVNDYLAERDAAWMGPVYTYLGITVGAILAEMDNEARREAYAKDITYGTNNEFGFDYLRDNMKWDISQKIQPKHSYAIVDEIDSILIDEARTPLIISGAAEDDTEKFFEVNKLVKNLKEAPVDEETGTYPENPDGDYTVDEKSKRISLTNQGMNHVEKLLLQKGLISGSVFDDENFEFIHYITQAVKAHVLFKRDSDYVVTDGQVHIVDEFTGRILHGRRYSDGLHQAIEAKENLTIARRNRTLATITFQNFFRMYDKLSGMTGTADTEATEFANIYKLDVIVIPTNRPVIRDDRNDLIYFSEELKFDAICSEIEELNKKGQPVLVGTVTIDRSEKLSRLLTSRGIPHEVLNAKNHAREATIIAEAGAKGAVTIATNMAGRGTDIKLGGNPEYRARKACGSEADLETYQKTLVKEREKWLSQYEEVKSLGGLYILGTERHESRRIDNQLRGRSGRQGDPGVSRFFLSLDDTLMRLFAKDNLKGLMGRLGMESGEPIHHQMISKAIERAQSKVEERNFEIRKHLLEYDDVLNEQRNFIYGQRDSILQDDALHERLLGTCEEMIDELIDEVKQSSPPTDQIPSLISGRFKETFHIEPGEALSFAKNDPKQALLSLLRENIQDKIDQVGGKVFNTFIRYQYLKQIDSRWQDHLEQMEALREAVYLRTYSQKNPLLEYKLEGFDIFESMLKEIRQNIARTAVRVRITRDPRQQAASPQRAPVTANHREVGQFGAAQQGGQAQQAQTAAAAAGGGGRPVQIKRSNPKVGRNDPCPCGSGKKYKHCCGR